MTITALFGTLLAVEIVGDICYKIFYRMVGRNKYRVGDIVWIRVNDVLEIAEVISITWRCHYRNEYGAKPEYHVKSLNKVGQYWNFGQSEILCKFKGKVEKDNGY